MFRIKPCPPLAPAISLKNLNEKNDQYVKYTNDFALCGWIFVLNECLLLCPSAVSPSPTDVCVRFCTVVTIDMHSQQPEDSLPANNHSFSEFELPCWSACQSS